MHVCMCVHVCVSESFMEEDILFAEKPEQEVRRLGTLV